MTKNNKSYNTFMFYFQQFCVLAVLTIVSAILLSSEVKADTTAITELSKADNAWVMLSFILVILMISPGVVLFYGGLVREKNIISIAAQCLVVSSTVFILWVLVGYGMAFGEGNAFIGSFSDNFITINNLQGLVGTIPLPTFIIFQGAFVAIASCLILGSVAERANFRFAVIFCGLWSLVVYAPICHWIWGGGMLSDLHAIEFAGGLIVHGASGVSALVLAMIVGNRKGFGTDQLRPHSPVLVMLGTALLWAGWFGFNGGSALAVDSSASNAIFVTQIAACSGLVSWTLIESFRGKPSLIGSCSGAIAGLVAITPAAGVAGPIGAILLGAIASPIAYFTINIIRKRIKIDDALDVFGIHGIVGIVATILSAVVASPVLGGAGYNGDHTFLSQLGAQTITAIITVLYAAIMSAIIALVVIRIAGKSRVNEEDEFNGLNITSHGEEASQ